MSDLRSEYESDYHHYAKYRELIISGQQSSSENIDKFVLTLSSASIGLLVTFLGKVLFDPKGTALVEFGLLESGLWALIFSLLFVISSMLLSSYIYQRNGRQCDKIMSNRTELVRLLDKEDKEDKEPTNYPEAITFSDSAVLRKITQATHYISPSLLIIGVILIGLFFVKNMEILKHGENTDTTPSNAASTISTISTACGTSTSRYSSATATAAPKSSTQSDLKEKRMNTYDEKSTPPPPPPPKAPERKE